MKPLIATAILLFAIVNLPAATTLYYGAYPAQAAQPAIGVNAGVGSNYLSTVDVPTPSAATPVQSSSGPGPNGPYSSVVEVSMLSGAVNDQALPEFSPQVLTLVLGVNSTVTWSNLDVGESHSLVSYSVASGASPFASGTVDPGSSYTHTFTVAGTYYYVCAECPWMKGIVVVK